MELAKIRNLSDEEIKHQEKTSSEQLFRLRFQVAMGQNDGVKKLRQLKKEIAQIKTVARERELGIHGEVKDVNAPKAEEAAPVVEAKAEEAAPEAKPKVRKTAKKAAPAAETKKEKAKGARK
ncbi:MAG: 50S ribosomal protein L29 [Terracidiphilus sp.]|jgi:large subunit ribosomal protein L29